MSFSPKEERPKLKARRFSRFEPSSDFKIEEECPKVTSNIPKRGYKRINSDEENGLFKPKRACTTSILNTPPVVVKNLANNRLKKLKEQIQERSNSNAEGNTYKNKTENKSVLHPNVNESKREVPAKLVKRNTNVTSPNYSRKNIAEKRLSNLKQKLDAEVNCQDTNCKSKSDSQKLDTQMQCTATGKSANQTPDRSTNHKNTSELVVESSNSYIHKMERTAYWVENHREQSNFHANIETSNNRLPETSERDQGSAKTVIDDGTDDMEWTNAEPDDDIIDVNKSVNETEKQEEDVKKIIKDPEKIKDICIVVDTNVFIWALSKIRDIVNWKISGSFKPIVYVPWMVITELDYMKDSCSDNKLSKSVLNAIKFINAALESNNHRVVGQTVFDVDKQKNVGTSPDDKIIACCLQATEKYETVMLLSNDINLKNKAMINNITTCSANEVMIKLMSKLARNSKFQKVMHKMGIMCSSIICDCMKAAYGDVWLRMALMNSPPWSLGECLNRFKKYWSAVFREKLLKQFTKTLQSLQDVIRASKYISDDSEEFVEFVKLCVTLCIFLKDIEECRGFVENTLAEITKTA